MNFIADEIQFDEKSPEVQNDQIIFKESEELSLGVEIELQLIDDQSLSLGHKAEGILGACSNPKVKREFYLSMIEINTAICQNAHEVQEDLQETLRYLRILGASFGVKFSTTGCHPFAKYSDCIVSPTERYHELIDRNQWLTRRMTVFGMHVHIGMKSGDDCIRFNNFFMHFLPHLLALSSSSPFWQGHDTGLASCRPTMYEALPTAGQPYCVKNWRNFEHLCSTLKKCDAITSLKDLWWDIRPSPNFGTLEIRVCDGLATVAETVAIVSFIHLLGHWFRDNGDWLTQVILPSFWIMRENKWRAMRYGLDGQLITSDAGSLKSIRQDVEDWLKKLSPYIEKLGYDEHISTLLAILERGTSSQRQRQAYHLTQSMEKVVLHNIAEFESGTPNWD